MSSDLAKKHCTACDGSIPPLTPEEILTLSRELSDWTVIENKKIEKEWKFKDFKQALHFTNKIGEIAEAEGHHPDIFLAWGKVKVTLWTHAINGLSQNDFILASKIDERALSSEKLF